MNRQQRSRMILLASLALTLALKGGTLSVDPDLPFTVRFNGQAAATAGMPEVFADTQVLTTPGGLTARGPNHRIEAAVFDDRVEYTYDMQFEGPVDPWRIMLLPLRPGEEAEIIHGTYEKLPETTTWTAADLPEEMPSPDTMGLRLVRFIRIRTPSGTWSLDCWPRGAMGYVPAAAASLVRCLDVRRVPDGIELRAVLHGPRALYNARMREKLIFYGDDRTYRAVHPFIMMNYRFAFEKVVRVDFSKATRSPKPGARIAWGLGDYDPEAGLGWLGETDDMSLVDTSLDAPIVGARIEGRRPAQFRIHLPPGHYYVTLNLGSPDAPTGPMTVHAQGKPRLVDVRLEPGRFTSEVVWVTTRGDDLNLDFSTADGHRWAVNALTVSSLGTLNEDFTLTRPWWHLDIE